MEKKDYRREVIDALTDSNGEYVAFPVTDIVDVEKRLYPGHGAIRSDVVTVCVMNDVPELCFTHETLHLRWKCNSLDDDDLASILRAINRKPLPKVYIIQKYVVSGDDYDDDVLYVSFKKNDAERMFEEFLQEMWQEAHELGFCMDDGGIDVEFFNPNNRANDHRGLTLIEKHVH